MPRLHTAGADATATGDHPEIPTGRSQQAGEALTMTLPDVLEKLAEESYLDWPMEPGEDGGG